MHQLVLIFSGPLRSSQASVTTKVFESRFAFQFWHYGCVLLVNFKKDETVVQCLLFSMVSRKMTSHDESFGKVKSKLLIRTTIKTVTVMNHPKLAIRSSI